VNDNISRCTEIEKTSDINGFYINAGSTAFPFIKCSTTDGTTSCIGVASADTDAVATCASATGKLCTSDSTVKVLINPTGVKVAEFITDPEADDVYYVMSNVQDNIFSGVTTDDSANSIIIRATTNAIIIHQIEDGVHAYEVDDVAEEVTLGPDGSLTDKSKLQLYLCAENLCTRTYGYARIGETDYIVHADATKDIKPRTLTTCGSATDIGHLYEESEGVKLCLNYDADTPIGSRKLDATGDAVTYVMENKLKNVFTNVDPADTNGVMIKSIPYAYVLDTKFKGRS